MRIISRWTGLTVCLLLSGNAYANLCEGVVSDKKNYPMTQIKKPGYLEAVIDPQFGGTIRRITDIEAKASGEAAVIKPMYSTVPAWNADETRLILWQRKRGHLLFDGKTYQFIKELDINPSDLEHVYWHATDPNLLFYPESRTQGSRFIEHLMEFNIKTNTQKVVHDFTKDGISGYHFGFGGDPMYSSWDSNYFGFAAAEEDRQYFTYSRRDKAIGRTVKVNNAESAPMPSPNGKLFLHDGVVFDFKLNKVVDLGLNSAYEHSSIGQLANGEQKLFHVTFDPGRNDSVGAVVMHDLETAKYKVLVGPKNGYPYPPSGIHLSALALKNPGWVAVSLVGKGHGQKLLDNELLLVNANPGQEQVCRIAHHRSKGRNGEAGYWAEPHAVISPTATRVLFASDWGDSSVDTYVVELPAYKSSL